MNDEKESEFKKKLNNILPINDDDNYRYQITKSKFLSQEELRQLKLEKLGI